MSGTDPRGPELLESGGERPGRRGAGTGADHKLGPLRRFARRHQRGLRVGAACAVAVGALGLRWYDGQPPPLPAIEVTPDRSADSVPLWSAGADGRPSSPLTLSVSSSMADLGRGAGGTQVTPIGLAGPGVSSPGAFPRAALTGSPVAVQLTGQVACDHVPIPVGAGTYSVQVRVTQGSRSRLVDLPLGSAGAAVASRVTVGCSTWLAARDVTLTEVSSAIVDPARPHVDLTLSVSNRGGLPALLWDQNLAGSGVRVSTVDQRVPAHGRATVGVSVDLDRCWTWDQTSLPVTSQDTPLGLQAATGVASPIPADQLLFNQPSGLVLTPVAARQLQAAFVNACGGVTAMVMLSDVGGARYDAALHRLTVAVLVDTPPGTVDRLRLLPSPSGGTNLVPLFKSSPWLVPDQSGQASYDVAFTVPAHSPCLGGGPFIALDVVAVAGPGGSQDRTVRFSLSSETFLPADQLQAACAGG
jgi:hypothetical protein